MFERLTEKARIEYEDKWVTTEAFEVDALVRGKAVDRLAAYEDSGLSPEQVQELAKAKAEGRIAPVKCPCDASEEAQELMNAKADGRLTEVTRGKWLPHTNVTAKCSACGGLYTPYKYCPNCGARMSHEAAEKAIAEVRRMNNV